MGGPLGGLVMLALAGLLAWAWWSGHLNGLIAGTTGAFSTPRPVTSPFGTPTSTTPGTTLPPLPPLATHAGQLT